MKAVFSARNTTWWCGHRAVCGVRRGQSQAGFAVTIQHFFFKWQSIVHYTLVAASLDALLLPKQITKCKYETCSEISVIQTPTKQCAAIPDSSLTPFADFQELQTRAKYQICFGFNGKLCLSLYVLPHWARFTHGQDHVSKVGMMIEIHWMTKGFTKSTQNFSKKYMICTTNNTGRRIQSQKGTQPSPDSQFELLHMDFIVIAPNKEKKCRGLSHIQTGRSRRCQNSHQRNDLTSGNSAKDLNW